ncbi:MAG TPA: hypothetical protein DCG32_08795 [Sphaerochaeta sp.]|nr:hypothetical protein [Sphaerochaeta sp.]
MLPTSNDDATLRAVKHPYPTLLVDTLILLVSIAILLLISSVSLGGGGGYVNVESPEGSFRYSLATDREVVAHGPLGETHIIIESGSAKIIDSPCPTKTCVHQGAISTASGWIACLPNQILLTIVSSANGEAEVDDVAN